MATQYECCIRKRLKLRIAELEDLLEECEETGGGGLDYVYTDSTNALMFTNDAGTAIFTT